MAWEQIQDDINNENWFDVDKALYERDIDIMIAELSDKNPSFEYFWDEAGFRSAIGFNDNYTFTKNTTKAFRFINSVRQY